MISRYDLVLAAERAYHDHTYRMGGVEVLIEKVGHVTVAAFRGTEFDGIDILRDLRGLPWWSRHLRAWCHSGFLKGVRMIWPKLGPALVRIEGPLYLTGHSKGGAETLVAAAFLTAVNGSPPAGVVTFGAPRACYGAAVPKILEEVPVIRVVHGNDLVPRLPPRFVGARHVGQLVHLADPEAGSGFAAHRMAGYCRALM